MCHNHHDIILATIFHMHILLHPEFIPLINLQGVAIINPRKKTEAWTDEEMSLSSQS